MKRVYVIGAGGIAHRHATVMKRIPELKVAGVCDVNPERAAAYVRKHGFDAAVHGDFAKGLAATECDYVVLLTPRGVRKPVIDLCLARRLPVIMEKPPCHDLPTGVAIRRDLEAAGLIHSVAFPHRYEDTLDQVLPRLRDETLSLVAFTFVAPMATRPNYDSYPDPYLVQRSGGLVGDQGIHYVDLARYITRSEPASIRALGARQKLPLNDRVTTVDAAGWVLVMENGVVVSHAHTWCGEGWACSLRLVTERSDVTVDLFGGKACGRLNGAAYEYVGRSHEDAFEAEHRAFLAALQSGSMAPVRSSYADALKSFAIAEQLNAGLYGPAEDPAARAAGGGKAP